MPVSVPLALPLTAVIDSVAAVSRMPLKVWTPLSAPGPVVNVYTVVSKLPSVSLVDSVTVPVKPVATLP